VSKRNDWLIGLGIALITIILILFMALFSSRDRSSDRIKISSGGNKIAVVELIGPIYDSRRIVRQFKQFGGHKSIRAIVFRVDSPGGGVAASQEIYEELKKTRETKKIVASMGAVAASGGYYIALPADVIVANPGTITGSIGVIMEFPVFKELLDKIGIEFEVVKSRDHKDIGSPFRKIDKEERDLLNAVAERLGTDSSLMIAGIILCLFTVVFFIAYPKFRTIE